MPLERSIALEPKGNGVMRTVDVARERAWEPPSGRARLLSQQFFVREDTQRAERAEAKPVGADAVPWFCRARLSGAATAVRSVSRRGCFWLPATGVPCSLYDLPVVAHRRSLAERRALRDEVRSSNAVSL